MKSIKLYLLSKIGKWIVLLLYNTNKWNIEGENNYQDLLRNNNSVIISIWHGRVLNFVKQLANNQFYALAGTHNDAEIISRICLDTGWKVIRGPSSDKGKEAFEGIVEALKIPGSLVAMTPDGPKGPAKIPKAGVIKAAQNTGVAIIPAASHCTKHWGFKNWDTFYIPKPFGRIEVIYGEPVYFKHDQSFDECLYILKEAMDKLEKLVDKRVIE